MTINFTKQMVYKLANIGLLLMIFGLLLWSQPWGGSSDETRKITVTGEAVIEAEPDEYLFTPRFELSGTDKDALKDQITEEANAAIAQLKELGAQEEDMKLDISSYDRWYWREGEEGILSASLTIKLQDKEVVQSVQDYLFSLDLEGSLTPQASFSESKKKEIDSQVTGLAIDDAKAKAEQQAKKFDAEVGEVIEVKQDKDSVFPLYSDTLETTAMDSGSSRASVPVLPGQDEYKQTITVTYELK